MDMDARTNHSTEDVNEGDGEDDDIDMQGGNRESSDEESDVEDDVDQELRENAATVPKVGFDYQWLSSLSGSIMRRLRRC
jgi:hypothetical protein